MTSTCPRLPAALAFASFLLANADHAVAQRIGTRVQYLHENLAGVQDDAEPYEGFGSSLASGDFNADGVDDLAVGVYNATSGTVIGEGAVQVFFGRSGGIAGEAESDDGFGGDGADDLAVGAPRDDAAWSDAGTVNVLLDLDETGLVIGFP